MAKKFFFGSTEQSVKKLMQDFLFVYNVKLVDMKVKKINDMYEGTIEFTDPYGEFAG